MISILKEHYINVDETDLETKNKYIDKVWELINIAYADIGGPSKKKEDIMKNNIFWKLVRRGGEIVACAIYKTDQGRKMILCGQDGTRAGKDEVNKILQDDIRLTDRKAWLECSGAVEKKMQKYGAIPIPFEIAYKLLKEIGKENTIKSVDPDGYHYVRSLGNGVDHEKMIYGNIPERFREKLDTVRPMSTQPLLEDKVVKFDNKTYPKFGWCVIMCGAPGSGKSTVLKNLIPIDAKIFDIDAIKEWAVQKGEIVDNKLIFNDKEYSLDGISEPYTLKNPEYVSFLHKNLKPLNNKIKDNLYKMGISAEEGRLPNIAFDIAGSDIDDFENIFVNLAPLGYKFCVVWVFNTLENALKNNQGRDRTGLRDLLIKKYFDVLFTVPAFMQRSDLVEYVNDFWIVLPVEFNIQTKDGKYKYIKFDNVKRLNPEGNTFNLSRELTDMIYTNQADALNEFKKEIE